MNVVNLPLSTEMTRKQLRPKPPVGFQTWLDYAVAVMDTRDAFHEQIGRSRTVDRLFERFEMRAAMLAELDKLRLSAGVNDTFPKPFRKGIEEDMQSIGEGT